MKREFVERFLCCPVCRNEGLLLNGVQCRDEELDSGHVRCAACERVFPVRGGIPFLYSDSVRQFVESGRTLTSESIRRMKEEGGDLEESVTLANIDYHSRVAVQYESDISTFGMFDRGTGSQARIEKAVRHLSERTPRQLWVDIGCGTGNVLGHAARRFDGLIGVDACASMLEIARDRGLPVMLADANHLPLRAESADVVSAFSVLHHWQNPLSLLQESLRVLRSGGFIYTDWDPNATASRIVGQRSPSRLFRLLRPAALKVIALLHRRRSSQHESEDVKAVSELAEYHHHQDDGLDPQQLVDFLKGNGCEVVDVYFHDNSDDLFSPARLRWMTRLALLMNGHLSVSDMEMYAPYFALIAKKG